MGDKRQKEIKRDKKRQTGIVVTRREIKERKREIKRRQTGIIMRRRELRDRETNRGKIKHRE